MGSPGGKRIRPRLRPIEPVPVELEGHALLALRDSDSYCDRTALIEPGAAPVLALFDGTRTLEQIHAWLVEQGVEGVSLEALEELERSLDECLLLDNERFRAVEAERVTAFERLPTRPAAHAGAAYPDREEDTRAFLDEILAQAPSHDAERFRRLIAPHIDLRLGAPVHAGAHRAFAESGRPDLVVVLGVCHALSDRRFIACRKDFDTPLGVVNHDVAFLDALEERTGESLSVGQIVHEAEHSVEFQALWLAHHWPGNPPPFVPILVGSFDDLLEENRSPSDDPEVERFIRALRATLDLETRRVVVIASVDLAHMGPRYGDAEGLDEQAELALERADLDLLAPVLRGDAEGFFAELSENGNARHVCGVAPIYVTLRLNEGEGRLLRYGQGRIDPATRSVVSYAAVALP